MKNELRIGNWVRHNDSWCYRGEDVYEFQWDESDWYALGECILDIENIEPIELTDEWLVKLGFNQEAFGDPVYFLDGFVVDLHEGEISWPNPVYKDSYCHAECPEFVHQLQNIYYYLIGKEL